MWYIYTMEYYPAIKLSEIMQFVAMWMDLEVIVVSKVSQRKTSIIWFCSCTEPKKKKKRYKWTYIQNRNRPTDTENKLVVIKGEKTEGEIN